MTALRKPAAALLLLLGAAAASFQLDTPQHVLDAARDLAYDGMALYEGNRSGHTPGKLSELDPMDDGPYWWWHGSVFLSAYVDYWGRTGDATYNKVVAEGLLAQQGEGGDYQPRDQRATMGNDHQCSWAVGAMMAAESSMPSPAKPDWLRLAQNVFDVQAARFEFEEKPLGRNYNCGGGLRSDIDTRAIGFDRKDTLANTCFLNLGARLAKFTGNETYAKYSERVWDWLWNINYIDHQTYAVYYGAPMNQNCTSMAKQQYSGSAAWLTEGAAFMYNFTKGSPTWRQRTEKLTSATLSFFFPSDVAIELECEARRAGGATYCSGELAAYKGQLVRSLATAARVAPFTAEAALPRLKKSAAAAVSQCTGGSTGRRCGFNWAAGNYTDPRSPGLLEQAHVLSAVSALVEERPQAASSAGGGGGGGGESGSGPGSGSGSPSGDKGTDKGGEKNAGAYARGGIGLVAAASVAGWASLLLL